MHLSPKAHPKFPSSEQVPPQSTSVSPALMIPSEQCAGVGLCVGESVGESVGDVVGARVGLVVGLNVGASVRYLHERGERKRRVSS